MPKFTRDVLPTGRSITVSSNNEHWLDYGCDAISEYDKLIGAMVDIFTIASNATRDLRPQPAPADALRSIKSIADLAITGG